MTIPKRTNEIIEEQLEAKTALLMPMQSGNPLDELKGPFSIKGYEGDFVSKDKADAARQNLFSPNKTTMPFMPGNITLPVMTTVPMAEPTTTFNSGGNHPGLNVQHDSVKLPTPPIVETTDKKPDEDKTLPILNERGNRPQSKGINFAIDIPRTYIDVPTSAKPAGTTGSSNLMSLINEFIPTKTAETDDDNLIIQEYIRNNHKISTSWE